MGIGDAELHMIILSSESSGSSEEGKQRGGVRDNVLMATKW